MEPLMEPLTEPLMEPLMEPQLEPLMGPRTETVSLCARYRHTMLTITKQLRRHERSDFMAFAPETYPQQRIPVSTVTFQPSI
jgi:hypothetical protein